MSDEPKHLSPRALLAAILIAGRGPKLHVSRVVGVDPSCRVRESLAMADEILSLDRTLPPFAEPRR